MSRIHKHRMSGIFDWFRKKKPGLIPYEPKKSFFEYFAPPPAAGLPAVRPETLPAAPPPKGPSLLDFFKPEAPGLLQTFAQKAAELAPPVPAGPPAPPEIKPEEKLWEHVFPAPAEKSPSWYELAPEPRVFPIYPSAEPEMIPIVDWAVRYPDIAERTGGRPPLWVMENVGWQIPHFLEIAEELKHNWDLNGLFDQVLSDTANPKWRQMVEQSTYTGRPAVLEIQEIAEYGNYYYDLARLFGIHENVIDNYIVAEYGLDELNEELFDPLLERFEKAMDILKPRSLKGWFTIEMTSSPNEEDFWLKYKEARFPTEK